MKENILQSVADGVRAIEQLASPKGAAFIEATARLIADAFQKGQKIVVAGNGGSLCDAMHFAEEFTGYFRKKRSALPAIALADPGFITCVGNDTDFDHIFSRGVEAHGVRGDIFVGLTTSGNSKNLVLAFEKAKEIGMKTIAFLGKGGGALQGEADLELIIEGFATSDRIQEAHMTAIHIMIEMVEALLFEEESVARELLAGASR